MCVSDLPAAWLSNDAGLVSKNLGIQLEHRAPVSLFLGIQLLLVLLITVSDICFSVLFPQFLIKTNAFFPAA
jgi:hypothetical protein